MCYISSSTLYLNSTLDWGGPRPGLFNPGKHTRYPLYSALCGPQGRSVPVFITIILMSNSRSKGFPPCLWVPVTTAWRVLRLRMEERPPMWRVAANKSNKQSRTADKGWSSSLGVGRGANNSSPWKKNVKNYSWARCFLWRQNNPEVIIIIY